VKERERERNKRERKRQKERERESTWILVVEYDVLDQVLGLQKIGEKETNYKIKS